MLLVFIKLNTSCIMNFFDYSTLYETVRVLGQGSYGVASHVKSKTTGIEAVKKCIKLTDATRKDKYKTENEVNILRQLDHPNIVKYIASWEEPDNIAILMEYCPYGDLLQYIRSYEGDHIDPDIVLYIFIQIALGLKYLHDRKILHRDLKGQNVFIFDYIEIDCKKVPIVKIGDFGISKILEYTQEKARTGIGTPYYFSPELCADLPYNNKSDVWSLGCILYELCTKRHAFQGREMHVLMQRILRGVYMPVPLPYRGNIQRLVDTLLSQKADDRPSVNNILRMPFITHKLDVLLNYEDIHNELEHTVLHNFKLDPYDSNIVTYKSKPRLYGLYGEVPTPSINIEHDGRTISGFRLKKIIFDEAQEITPLESNSIPLTASPTSFKDSLKASLAIEKDELDCFEEPVSSRLDLMFVENKRKAESEEDRLLDKIERITDYVSDRIGKGSFVTVRGYFDLITKSSELEVNDKFLHAILKGNSDLITPLTQLMVCTDLFNKNS